MVQRVLITLGVVLLVLGLLWPWLQKMGLGRLPGDLVIERENFRLYFPLATSIIISLIVTLLFWLFRR
jgi:ribose/xylose/arabinose/galactoside ABC-type transport system permease subunit